MSENTVCYFKVLIIIHTIVFSYSKSVVKSRVLSGVTDETVKRAKYKTGFRLDCKSKRLIRSRLSVDHHESGMKRYKVSSNTPHNHLWPYGV